MLPASPTPAVRRIAGAYAGSVLLEWAADIALMVTVYAATGSATAAALMLVCTQLIPNLGVAGLASKFDAFDTRPLLIGATAIRGLALLLIAVFGYGPALFAAAIAAGAGAAVARCQLRASLARLEHADPGTLRAGNGLLGALRGPCALLGPIVGGALVAAAGHEGGLLVLGGLQLILAAGVAAVPNASPIDARSQDDVDEPLAQRFDDRQPTVPLAVVLAFAACIAFAFSVDEPVLMKYSDVALGAGVGGYSAFFVAFGGGLLLGGLAFSRLTQRPMLPLFVIGLALNGIGHLGLAAAPSLNWALVAAALAGFGNGFDFPALTTLVQEAAPSGRESRVAARFEGLTNVGIGLGVLAGGAVADLLGARVTLLVPSLAAGCILLMLLPVFLRSRRWQLTDVPRLSTTGMQGGVS